MTDEEKIMQQTGWKEFLKLCLEAKDEQTLDTIFDLLLTPEERESIATRILIVKSLINQKKPQREIAQDLKVSIAKITRGSNELKRINAKFKKYLEEKLK